MDFKELKKIIEEEGGKVIIVENDKPTFVVMSFDEWRKNTKRTRGNQGSSLQTEEEQHGSGSPKGLSEVEERSPETLSIDDLPV